MLITGNRDSKKIIVILLLICLIFSNCFALLSPLSFAETNELGKQNTTQFIENINYDVNFVKNDEILGYEYESTVDEKELAIHIAVEVKQEGYLKDGKVLIESENGLSFNIQENNVVNGNVVNLSNVSEGQKIDLVLPITYKEREDIENLNKKINCQLFGTYVNNLGEEKEIYENVVLRLIWKINTEYDITSNIEKYIPYNNENGKGIIVQTSLNTLIPNYNSYVEREKINIDAVQLEGYKIENLSISEKNGDELLSDKWSYDEENNRISIRLENNSETIKSQEYIVTYNFSGEDEIELPLKINSNVSGSIFMFRNNESKDIEKEIEYNVTKKVGEIITFDAVSDAEMKIGKLIANKISKQNQYSLNYNVQLTSNISSTDLVEGILIKDNGEEFINKKEIL